MFRSPSQDEVVSFLSSPALTDKLHEIINHPQRNIVLYSQLAFLFVFLVFRSWRKSKGFAFGWIGLLWFKLWTLLLYVTITFFVIPEVILGKPYLEFTKQIYHFLMRSFWKST